MLKHAQWQHSTVVYDSSGATASLKILQGRIYFYNVSLLFCESKNIFHPTEKISNRHGEEI